MAVDKVKGFSTDFHDISDEYSLPTIEWTTVHHYNIVCT